MSLRLNGSTSGYVEIDAPAVAGTTSITVPATSGEALVKAADGSVDLGGVDIDSSGRLLVGTSTALTAPDSVGTQRSAQFSLAANSFAGTLQTNSFFETNATAGAYTFTKSNSGTVGNHTIVASGNALGTLQWAGSDGTNYIRAALIQAEVDGTPGANAMPGRLVFSTTAAGASSPTERVRITNYGTLQVSNAGSYGASNPTFHDFSANSASDLILRLRNTSSTTPYGVNVLFDSAAPNDTTRYFLNCVDNAAVRATIRSNGGLANFSANNVNLSDRNVKKDIAPAAGTWDCLKEWEIVNFRYKDQPDDADLNMGVIAQQVAESCPEVITVFQEATEDQPEKLGVKDQQMMWMAIKALQEAQLRIETLEAEVAALKGA